MYLGLAESPWAPLVPFEGGIHGERRSVLPCDQHAGHDSHKRVYGCRYQAVVHGEVRVAFIFDSDGMSSSPFESGP